MSCLSLTATSTPIVLERIAFAATIIMAGAPQQPLTFNDVFEDDDDEVKEAPTVHHIRANSSIMQVKKILGMLNTVPVSKKQQLIWAFSRLTSCQPW